MTQCLSRFSTSFRCGFTALVLAVAITSLTLAPACDIQQAQKIVNDVNQYLPTALAVASDIIAILPLLSAAATPDKTSQWVTDAQQFEDAVQLISSTVAAYLQSKNATALGKVNDAVTQAKTILAKLLSDIHVVSNNTVTKILAYGNLASLVLNQLSSIVGAPSVSAAVRAIVAFTPAQAAAQLNVVTAMPSI